MRRVQSLGDPAPLLETYCQETAATIERLASLAATGKQVTLKFYDDPPFWNLVVTGEYVWVQYCHDGQELKSQPEYVFALQKEKPTLGLFSASTCTSSTTGAIRAARNTTLLPASWFTAMTRATK